MNPRKRVDEKSNGVKKAAGKHRDICPSCRRPAITCLCPLVRPFFIPIPFVILIHPRESREHKTGTGRLTHLCLENSRILTGIDFTDDPNIHKLLDDPSYAPAVLFPSREPVPLDDAYFSDLQVSGRTPLIFVIDGTWIGARKMLKLSRNLDALPRICLIPEQPSRFKIKHQPHPWCLSTIEAVHNLIEIFDRRGLVETDGRHGVLLEVLDGLVGRQARFAADMEGQGYRKRPTKPAAERVVSLKNRRRIPFPDDI